MRREELIDYRKEVVRRMCKYCECSESSAMNFLRLMLPTFSTEGGMLFHISDNLDRKGY